MVRQTHEIVVKTEAADAVSDVFKTSNSMTVISTEAGTIQYGNDITPVDVITFSSESPEGFDALEDAGAEFIPSHG